MSNGGQDELPVKEAGEKCNARKTDGSGYCKHPAGWGTDHNGYGRCKFHGGNTQAQEQNIISELEEAAEHASVALRLKLKQAKEKAERGEFEDIDWGEIDRLSRTAFDRTGHGKTETTEHTGEDGGGIIINMGDE